MQTVRNHGEGFVSEQLDESRSVTLDRSTDVETFCLYCWHGATIDGAASFDRPIKTIAIECPVALNQAIDFPASQAAHVWRSNTLATDSTAIGQESGGAAGRMTNLENPTSRKDWM